MNRRKWLWAALVAVPAAVGGIAYASTTNVAKGYTCPVTGEELPCERCCPLNGEAGQAATGAKAEGDFICPITGEKLGCPSCCPLNGAKN